MHIESIELFLAVAETRSFTKAAQAVHISPQGASAAIKTLERHLGVELFDRSAKTLSLTKEGRLIHKEAEVIAEAHRRMAILSMMPEFSSIRKTQVQIVATPFAFQLVSFINTFTDVFTSGECRIAAQETNLYGLSRRYPELHSDTLYILDFPYTDMSAIEQSLSAAFMHDVLLNEKGVVFPLVATELMLMRPRDAAHNTSVSASWTDIDLTRLACYNDPVLIDEIKYRASRGEEASIGAVTSNTSLLFQAIEKNAMCYITDSVSIRLKELAGMDPLGTSVELLPRSLFCVAALYTGTDETVFALIDFLRRYLQSNAFPPMSQWR